MTHDALVARFESDESNPIRVASKRSAHLVAVSIPQSHRLVPAAAGNELTVVAEGDRTHPAVVPSEPRASLFAGLQVPQLDRIVLAPAREKAPIAAERERDDGALVLLRIGNEGAVSRAPHRDDVAIASDRYSVTVGTEGYGPQA